MKKGILIAVAVAIGGFFALQANNWIEGRRALTGMTKSDFAIEGKPILVQNKAVPAGLPDLRAASKRVLQSVVSVDASGTVEDFFGRRQLTNLGGGSGVIISENGYIVTNNHVITNPSLGRPAEILKVHLPDDTIVEGKLVGFDQRSDLAVIKVNRTGLVPIDQDTAYKPEIGEWVLAAGSPLGYDNTISVGVISSLDREVDMSGAGNARRGGADVLTEAIQTDAAINPGNSGGALTNVSGTLLGINTVIASNTGTNVGIGFAIPASRVRQVAADIIKYGYVKYGSLGILVYPNPDILKYERNREAYKAEFGAYPPSEGLVIEAAQLDSPAAKLGIEQYSILLAVEGKKMTRPVDLQKALLTAAPGKKVNVRFWKKGKTYEGTVTLTELANN
jgi:S1-C subfamily serine protease